MAHKSAGFHLSFRLFLTLALALALLGQFAFPAGKALASPLRQDASPTAPTDGAAESPTPEAPTETPTPEPPAPTQEPGAPVDEAPTPAPTEESPTSTPTEEIPAATPTAEPPSDEEAVQQALDQAIQDNQEKVLALMVSEVVVDSMKFSSDRNQALVFLAFHDLTTGENIATEPGLAVANRLVDSASGQSNWQVTLQSDEAWAGALTQVLPELMSDEDKALYMPPTEDLTALAGVTYTGYHLPWAPGQGKYLTGSIGHVFTYKSCPTTCMYAFDFADGTMFPILAAKGGTVKYAVWEWPNNDHDHTNYLILEDTSTTPTTYQVYYHLAQNSIPTALRTAGAVVQQGQFIANADNTGYSTGSHLHYHVHTTAGSVWGTSVDITFEEVGINGGRPRTCSEAEAYPEYGAQCNSSNLFVSNNSLSSVLPPAPILLAPTGTVTTSIPTYQWRYVPDAVSYKLVVTKVGAATPLITLQLSPPSVCNEGICSITPTTSLGDGSYLYKVQAKNAYGWGHFSPAGAFTAAVTLPPPALISPNTTNITTPKPPYTWEPVEGATQYYLMVYSVASGTYVIYRTLPASQVCLSDTCSYISTVSLKMGSYKFKVRSGNALGWGQFSAWMPFTTYLIPPAPVLTVMPNPVITNRPTYRWSTASLATGYYLKINNATTTIFRGQYTASTICLNGACSIKPAVSLPAGSYKFQVRALNSYGWGPYSAWMPFTVTLLPPVPTLVSPSGTITNPQPPYTWNAVERATQYYLMVYSPAEAAYVIYRTLSAGTVCANGTCSYVSTIAVSPGDYRFKVRAGNAYGWSLFSPFMDFTVQ